MRKIVFIVLICYQILALNNLVCGQAWDAFLEKHIDNLTNADSIPGLSHQYTDEIIQQKKAEMLNLIYTNNKHRFQSPTGKCDPSRYPVHSVDAKHEGSALNAVLQLGNENEKQNARNFLYNAMLLTEPENTDIDFTSYLVAYILNLKPEAFTPEKELDLRDYFAENFGEVWGHRFWQYWTENHCQLHRSTTYGVGLKWPDHSFIIRQDGSRESGTYMYNQIEEKHIFKYMPYLYKYGMGENLSPNYMMWHMRPWTVFYELAREHNREAAKGVSGAILEYYYALEALNSQHNMYAGLVDRARNELRTNWNFDPVGKIFGGFGYAEPVTEGGGSLIAESDYIPHEKTRSIIAGDIRMPYSLLQTCATSGWYYNEVRIDDSGRTMPTYEPSCAKRVFRYVYTDRHFTLGSGNIKTLPGDEITFKHGITGSATWENGALFFSSPKGHVDLYNYPYIIENWGERFFYDHKQGYSGPFGSDSWIGYSPFLEMAQFENTMLVYCLIPSSEPYRLVQIHLSRPVPQLGEEIIADDFNRTLYAKYNASEGFVYIGIIPMHYTWNNRQTSGFINTERIVDDGSGDDGHCGYVVEMAHSSECSFEEFKNRVKALNMSWSKANAKLAYTNRKGHTISLTHSSHTDRTDGLPTIEITPFMDSMVTVDWENYPTLRSPYMRIMDEDSRTKLVINDNTGGIKIDFDGNLVNYNEFDDFVPGNSISDTLPPLKNNYYSVQLEFIDSYFKTPLTGLDVIIYGVNYVTNDTGVLSLPEIHEGYYNLELTDNDLKIEGSGVIEVRSDSVIRIPVIKMSEMNIQISNRTTGSPIYRAVVKVNDITYFSNSSGVAEAGKHSSGLYIVSAEHNEYFSLLDTLTFLNDTTYILYMTPMRADITFKVSDINGPLSGVKVNMTGSQITNSAGNAFFYLQPARETYAYSLERAGYKPVHSSLFLERDTTLQIVLEIVSSIQPGILTEISVNPNPFDSYINVIINESSGLFLYDFSGNLRYSTKLEQGMNSIPTDNLENGGFILKIINRNRVHYRLLVK